jgi:diacylglycerol kinase (ATP)
VAATRVLIIANPAAGTVTPALVWELVRVCRRQVRDVSVRWTTAPGEATRIARRAAESVPFAHRALAFPTAVSAAPAEARTVVVAVGGDGTVREVAAGLASAWRGASPTPLLIVPAGTANSGYHALFGESPWQSTVESLLTSSAVRWLDLARVAGRLVFAGASAGSAHPCPSRVTVDGRVVHSGPMRPVSVGIRDGLLDVQGVVHERGRRVTIERTDGQPLRFEHDGEVLPLGPTEYTIDVVPTAVPVPTEFAAVA